MQADIRPERRLKLHAITEDLGVKQKVVVAILFAVIVVAACVQIWTWMRYSGEGVGTENRLTALRVKLERAVRAAERTTGGKAVSMRLDDRSSPSRWIIGIDKNGESFDVVVESSGEVAGVAPHVQSKPPGEPHAR